MSRKPSLETYSDTAISVIRELRAKAGNYRNERNEAKKALEILEANYADLMDELTAKVDEVVRLREQGI